MNKNILVITGSPRKKGNSTLLAEAFIKGATAQGHTVTVFNAADKDIKGCKACGACWSKGTACVFTDGFTELEPLLEQTDAVVFASPLYWFSFSAQIKAAIDKMNAYDSENTRRPLKVKEGALLVCGAGEDMQIFEGINATYKSMLTYLGWCNAGIVAVTGVQEKGDILKTEGLVSAEKLGLAF